MFNIRMNCIGISGTLINTMLFKTVGRFTDFLYSVYIIEFFFLNVFSNTHKSVCVSVEVPFGCNQQLLPTAKKYLN